MGEQRISKPSPEEIWRSYLMTGKMHKSLRPVWFQTTPLRSLIVKLPQEPRCRICQFPFSGVGGTLVRYLMGVAPSRLNPQLCNVCEQFAEQHQGGAEVELTMVFADVRGSTRLAEGMAPLEFSRLISRFYNASTKVLFDTNAMVEKLIGDEVTGFYVPGFVGPNHARVAVDAAREILQATGHGSPSAPWIPVGVGVHTGIAYVGSVSSQAGVKDIAVLGDTPNTASRLASVAGTGEVVISEAARAAAGLEIGGMEQRQLQLKGRSEPVDVWILRVGPD